MITYLIGYIPGESQSTEDYQYYRCVAGSSKEAIEKCKKDIPGCDVFEVFINLTGLSLNQTAVLEYYLFRLEVEKSND